MAGRPYTVVVGVSDTSGSPIALQWAQAAAGKHGRIIAVLAWRPAPASISVRPTAVPSAHATEVLKADAERQLGELVSRALGPEASVELRVVRGPARKVLVEASQDADLMVVDAARSTVAPSRAALAKRLIADAHCPVAVMPLALTETQPPWLRRAAEALGRGIVKAAGTAGRPGLPPIAP